MQMKLFFLVLFLLTVTNGDTNRQLKIENTELKIRNTVSILLEIRDIEENFTGDYLYFLHGEIFSINTF